MHLYAPARAAVLAAALVVGGRPIDCLAGSPLRAAPLDTSAKPGVAPAGKADAAAAFFGSTRVWPIHLTLSVENWKRMQPPPAKQSGFSVPIGAVPPPTAPHPKRGGIAGRVGLEFPEVRATMELGGKSYAEIGLRFKGNATYLSTANTLKRPLKIDLNAFVKGQECFGLATLNLNNNVTDASQMRETLAYQLHREAGLPAPRTAYARVYLTVPGIYERTYLGLYTLIEQVDARFLKDRLGNGKGLLLKPDQIGPMPYLGEEWLAYDAAYWPKSNPSENAKKRLIAFTRLIHKSDEREFQQQIRSFVDVDHLLKFVAVNSLIANMDSFLSIGQNYYLYHHPEKDRFYFIPWDVDLAFGVWGFAGSAAQQTELSIMQPYTGDHPLIRRLLAMPEVRAAYQEHVRRILATSFRVDRIEATIARTRAAIRPAIAEELPEQMEKFNDYMVAADTRRAPAPEPERGGFGMRPPMPLRQFIALRVASVERQLAGKSKGFVPETPPFGGGGRGPGAGPRRGGPGRGGPPPGPGMFLAPPVLAAIDSDGDSKLTPEEFQKGAADWSTRWDADKSGALSNDELKDGINGLLMGPRGPGGPGRPGGRGGPGRPGGAGGPGGPGRPGGPGGRGGFGGQSAGLPPLAPNDPAAEIRGPGRDGGPFGGGPGGFIAPAVLKAADADQDGNVSPTEFQEVIARWASGWDADKSGAVGNDELRDGLNQLLGPPPGAPPRGAPPAGDVLVPAAKEGGK
jgi:spore coat protein CotH